MDDLKLGADRMVLRLSYLSFLVIQSILSRGNATFVLVSWIMKHSYCPYATLTSWAAILGCHSRAHC